MTTSSVDQTRRVMVGPAWTRWVAAVVVSAAVGIAAAAGLSTHDLAMRTAEGWFPWLEFLSTDGLLLGSALVLIAGNTRIWTAWAAVAASIPANLAAMVATAHPLLAWAVASWPSVAIVLSAKTFARLRQSTEYQEEER